MGEYNPHLPQIAGQEWVGIQEQDLLFDFSVNTFEQGHTFALTASRTLQDGRFYITNPPENFFERQVYTMAVYPEGTENQSGPVRSVIIPCNNGAMTGAGATFSGGATTVAQALQDPSHETAILIQSGNAVQNDISIFFAVNTYAPLLYNKRILGVKFLYGLEQNFGADHVALDSYIMNNAGSTQWRYPDLSSAPFFKPLSVDATGIKGLISEISLGDTNVFFVDPLSLNSTIPWTYTDLQRFEATSGVNRLHVHLRTIADPDNGDDYFLAYGALQVFYCEEQRVAYGSAIYNSSATAEQFYLRNTNIVTMRTLAGATSPVLTAGNYTLTLAQGTVGDAALALLNAGPQPTISALRQLYQIPPQRGVLIEKPRLFEENEGQTFTVSDTPVLPQLSLHTSSGTMTEPHAYGRQARAEVWGTVTATQEILDAPVGGARSFPWVRYYARRFGDTTIPLILDNPAVSGTGTTVSLTPAAWDALDEIVDGWKEVTLRWTTAPTMGAGTSPQFRWSAPGEDAGNRWEVLGVRAPALSGVPGNLVNPIPAPNQLSGATYGAAASGATINLGWIPQHNPPVSATVDDQTADAVIMFAQDMPTVTGVSVEFASQALSGIGQDCGVDPCCIPTELYFNEVSWSLPVNTGVASDEFERIEAAGSWGSADVGGAYSLSASSSDFSVNGTQGLITPNTSASQRIASLTTGSVDFDIRAVAGVSNIIVAGTSANVGVVGRFTDSNSYYLARLIFTSAGVGTLFIERRAAAVTTTLVQAVINLAGGAGAMMNIRFVGYGAFFKAKVWLVDSEEPDGWDLETFDATPLTTGVQVGAYARSDGLGNTIAFETLNVTPPGFWFSKYELQRMDTVEPTWQTIMASSNPGQSSFNDWEARVGIESTYRIRMVDTYDFPGPWSAEVSSTVPAPGVLIGCEGGHLLIFTSNERQDGSVNLAYSSVWEGNVEEGFEFPEAQFVQLQAMYGRDFFTAFRPTERGGDRYSRTVLVQAAAIAPETLADFVSLRDMAWANTSYICVRDEDGNRWFATVLVPAGRVTHYRKLYMAPVEIIEVTATPSEVDP